jgi:cell division septal protein FtsQ
VEIVGNEKVAANSIKDIVFGNIGRRIFFFNTKSIFFLNLKKAEKILLESFPRISQVDWKKRLLKSLLVKIKERNSAALFCQNDDCFLIDQKGVIFEKSPEAFLNDVIIEQKEETVDLSLGSRVFEDEEMEKILKIKSAMDKLGIALKKIFLVSETRINVKTREGWEVYFNPEKDLGWQITELNVVVQSIASDKRKKLRYIDLRFNKVYIFPGKLLN